MKNLQLVFTRAEDFIEEANLWYDLHETKFAQKRLWERGRWAKHLGMSEAGYHISDPHL